MKKFLMTMGLIGLLSGSAFAQSEGAPESKDTLIGIAANVDIVTSVTENEEGGEDTINSTEILLNLMYGVNQGIWEYGGFFEYDSEAIEDADPVSTLMVGGFGDYNLSPNDESAEGIWAVRARLGVGLHTNDGDSGTALRAEVGPAYKYFGFAPNFAVLGEVLYRFQQITVDDLAETGSGPAIRVGMQYYF